MATLLERFIESYDVSIRTRMEALIDTIQSNHSFTDLEEFLTLTQGDIANDIAGLSPSHGFVTGFASELQSKTSDLLSTCNPKDNIEERFYSLFGSNLSSGLSELTDTLTEKAIINSFKDIATADTGSIEETIAGLSCTSTLTQDFSANLTSDIGTFLNNVTRQISFTAAIHPEDNNYQKVYVKCFDDTTSALIGEQSTSGNGVFQCSYSETIPEDGSFTPVDLKFEVYIDSSASTPFDTQYRTFDPGTESSFIVNTYVVPAPTDTSPNVSALTSVGITFPTDPDFLPYLSAKGVTTLEDVRNKGGIYHFSDLPSNATPELIATIDNYALLTTLSTDLAVCQDIFDSGHKNIFDIVSTPRANFINAVLAVSGTTITNVQAGQLYAVATGINQTANTFTWASAVDRRNGNASVLLQNVAGSSTISSLLSTECNCNDCESGVSPLAYLSSLIKYITDNVKNSGAAINISYLESKFYQPFGQLSTDCEEVNKKVCQIRVCIDVLRKYYSVNGGSIPSNAKLLLRQSTKEYLIDTYNTILRRIGTSYEELKETPDAQKEALAKRLGIDVSKLSGLILDIVNADITTNDAALITFENDLERIFGFPSTVRNPLSQGYSNVDPFKVTKWDITGARWGYNTDSEGYIYLGSIFDEPVSGMFTLYLHKSSSFSENTRVAVAVVNQTDYPVLEIANFTPLNNSGIFGNFHVAVDDDISGYKFSLFPEYVSWKLQKTNEEWKIEDNQLNNIFTNTDSTGLVPAKRHKYPFVDPDIISLDDIRDTFNAPPEADTPAGLWVKRREWMDDLSNQFYFDELFGGSPDYIGPQPSQITNLLQGYITYGSSTITPWEYFVSDYGEVYKILLNPSNPNYETTVDDVITKAHLYPNEYIRMYELLLYLETLGDTNKEYNLTVEQRNSATEYINLAILVIKRAFFDVWVEEEQDDNIWLNQQNFYKSLTQPKTGIWPTIIQPFKIDAAAVPLIEPGFISLADMVDAKMLYHEYSSTTNLQSVYNAYTFRKNKLLTDLENIKNYREAQDKIDPETNGLAFGFSQLIVEEDTGVSATDLFNYMPNYTGNASGIFEVRFFKLYEDIKAGNTDAITDMQSDTDGLAMSIPEFYDLFDYYQTCLEQGLTDAQWQAAYELMQKGLKRRHYYTTWNTEESVWIPAVVSPATPAVPLKYWQVQKQKLVKWLAPEEIRKTWVEFLERTALPPVLDPDYTFYSNFIDPRDSDGAPSPTAYTNIPFTLWKDRTTNINSLRASIINYDDILDLVANFFKDPYFGYDFIEVYNDYVNKGIDISGYLSQWNLTYDGFIVLGKAYNASSLSDADWEILYDIVVDVAKKDNTESGVTTANYLWADMQRQEAIDGIYISPQVFALPPATSLSFNLAVQDANSWLVNPQLKKEWQQKLTSRVDFQNALIKNNKDLIENIEDDNLIQLRDALVVSIYQFQFDQEKNANWITDNLLIDAKTNCCSATTRVAQAIETLQVFMFGLRNGQLADNYPTLSIDNDYFDDHWQWLGTYGNWRSLMFTYLYPENLLDPAYREVQTGKFREITDAIVSNARFNPTLAKDAAQQYKDYYDDVISLELEASVTVKMIDKGGKFRMYMIGRGQKTGNLYWSKYDLADVSGGITGVSTWEPIPGLGDTTRVAGATQFKVSTGEAYLYVMANLRKDKTSTVRYNRYNLTTLSWDAESTEIEVDKRFDATTAILETTFDSSQIPFVGMKQSQEEKDFQRLFVFQFNKEGKALTDKIRATEWIGELYSMTRVIIEKGSGVTEQYCYCFSRVKIERRGMFQFQSGMFKANPTKSESGEEWFGGLGLSPTNIIDTNKTKVYVGTIYQYKEGATNRIHLYYQSINGPAYMTLKLGFVSSVVRNDLLDQKTTVEEKTINYIGPVNGLKLYEDSNKVTLAGVMMGGIGGGVIRNGQITLSKAVTPVISTLSFGNAYLKPVVSVDIDIDVNKTPNELQRRRYSTLRNLSVNNDTHISQWLYLQEYYYFMPMLLAIQLQKNKFYTQALDWYKMVFDYTAPLGRRKIYYGLTLEEVIPTGNVLSGNVSNWLTSPTDPHQIAALRPNNYTRFTVYSVIQCLLDFADTEYTRDTSETVPRARSLYSLALDLLKQEVFTAPYTTCDEMVNSLDWLITEPTVWDTWVRIKDLLGQVDSYATLNGLANPSSGTITDVLTDSDIPLWEQKFEKIIYLIQTALKQNSAKVSVSTQIAQSAEEATKTHLAMLAGTDAVRGISQSGAIAVASVNTAMAMTEGSPIGLYFESAPSVSFADSPYSVNFTFNQLDFQPFVLLDKFDLEFGNWQKSPASGMLQNQAITPAYLPLFTNYYCVVPNPIPEYMQMHAEIQLLKIRNCMNISGLKRELDPYSAPIDSTSGIPSLIGGGRLNVSSTIPRSATIYRYQFLVERAKQLVSYAQQMESSLLSALEKRDAEYYTIMKAKQDLNISRASVKLNDLRLKEAESGVVLAQMQRDRSQLQVDGLQKMIDDGLNKFEKRIIDIQIALASIEAVLIIARAVTKDLDQNTIGAGLASISAGASSVAAAAGTAARLVVTGTELAKLGLNTTLQISSTYASQARREQEWNFQKTLGEQDIKIGGQQIKIAEDRVRIVGQEKRIAEMQSSYAEDTLNFLSSKFTNVQLYEWIVRILQRTYDFMLQQATSVAKTAQMQLAFERQESPTGIIQDDYWEAPADATGGAGSTDRRGLTGSTRLLADIIKLESYAIDTNRRKLQLTKTISLSTYFPIEFQQFRETGQFSFQTNLQHFDRDFPGHYLRLIRSVRTSVIALTPPNEGIKATLANTGTSTVIIKANNSFVPVRSRKDPDSVALTSPFNASGMFEMQQQDPNIYLPFEGTGVETSWYFEMLKANNPFDFSTIADVVLTIDYTALEDFNYKVQKWKEANLEDKNANGSRMFSMRSDFADQWYDLSNGLLSVTFDISKFNFPVNATILQGGNAKVYVSFAEYVVDKKAKEQPKPGQTSQKLNKVSLNLEDKGVLTEQNIDYVAGELPQISGPYLEFPYGTWKFETQDTDLAAKIKFGVIQDIIVVIEYQAKTVAYPTIG